MKPRQKVVPIRTTSKTEINNFWRVCPRVLSFLPESHCEQGKPELTPKGGVKTEGQCDWWINSPEHNFCFWRYVHENSAPDGSMKELVQSKLANMLGLSNTKVHFMLKEAQEEFVAALYQHGGLQLIEDIKQVIDDGDGFNPFYKQSKED